jgi:anti-anti-sigma factor
MQIKTRESHNIIIFDIKGEVTRREETPLHQHVKSQLEVGKRNFLLNFENIPFIDSYGVGELIASFKSIHDLGGKLKLMKLPPRIKLLFKITMIEKIFKICDDEEAAIKNFSN